MLSDFELLRSLISEIVKRCKAKDKQKGKSWCLYTRDGKCLLGRHKTPHDAYAQEKAIHVSEEG